MLFLNLIKLIRGKGELMLKWMEGGGTIFFCKMSD